MLKEEFPPVLAWFKAFKVRLDLGYLGFDKDYECESVYLPAKAKKKTALSAGQKLSNQALASQRVSIEHSISGLKDTASYRTGYVYMI